MIKKHLKNPVLFKILFVVAVAVLLFIASLNYKHNQDIQKSTEMVMHIHKVNFELEKIISFLKDGQRGLGGYLITRDSTFLKPYFSSRKKVRNSFKILDELTLSNPIQQENIKSLSALINKKYENFDKTINYFVRKEDYSDKIIQIKINLDKVIMDSIIKLSEKMGRIEDSYLTQRNSIYNYQLLLNPLFAIGTVIITLLFLVTSYIKINDDIKILQQSNDNLLFLKTSNDQSEILGEYSSWFWNLDTNEMTFSDNQYRMLGYEPQSFEASNSNFFKFVHPEDTTIMQQAIEKIIVTEKLPSFYYRIIRKNNEIRHYKSSGTLLHDRFQNRIIIGNTRDVTDELAIKLGIEIRNLELEQRNNELMSFNYVASHDLQEPLRKIQTFISRFSDSEVKNLSQNSQGYFVKIKTAVTKMRALIDDLLLYSRTNKGENKFELFNLNETLEQSKQELSQAIKESNTKIISEELPTLAVISFQMQQLFVNLIGNSIKYAKNEIRPIIKITCDKINADEFPILIKPVAKVYYKIDFNDNGIGFDEQYAEKIFILFYRLISDRDYQGTGIGLTICKKIAENHLGHLFAQSETNVGSTFTLFLPIL